MKTLVIALNSKYIHASLAPWYLKSACGTECGEIMVLEHTVNENINDVLTSIYLNKPDVAAFSCYIWNITLVLKLASSLRKILPGTFILLGGPEVSYDAVELLEGNPFVDFILAGEGEESFPKLLRLLASSRAAGQAPAGFMSIDGLAWRHGSAVAANPPALIRELDTIVSPYTDEMLSTIKNRIVYFEASRGCPFSCSYCLSSASEGIRYFSLERVFAELDRLAAAGAGQIKFVDRTFNCHKGRALAIVRHIAGTYRNMENAAGKEEAGCNFHFEVGADLFDEELLQVLSAAPKGLFQIEAGVQTVNEGTLAAINRKTNTERLLSNLKRLRAARNIHIHADLIAGLPREDYDSFGNSFNRVYSTEPDQLQVGFLKFLKGTRMREDASGNGYLFNDFPPYEILSGRHMGQDELIILKGIAGLVEKYYNSGRFAYSLQYVIRTCFHTPFRFYEAFYSYCSMNGHTGSQTGLRELYAIFFNFASGCMRDKEKAFLLELLRLDFLSSDPSGTLPGFMEVRSKQAFVDKCFEFLKQCDLSGLIPEIAGLPPKQQYKKVHFDILHVIPAAAGVPGEFDWSCDTAAGHVYLFNHASRDPVTGRYPFYLTEDARFAGV